MDGVPIPQFVMLFLCASVLALHDWSGDARQGKVGSTLTAHFVLQGLLFWGGFWSPIIRLLVEMDR